MSPREWVATEGFKALALHMRRRYRMVPWISADDWVAICRLRILERAHRYDPARASMATWAAMEIGHCRRTGKDYWGVRLTGGDYQAHIWHWASLSLDAPAPGADAPQVEGLQSSEPAPDAQADTNLRLATMRDRMALLPPDVRPHIERMARDPDYGVYAWARHMGMSPDTVRKRVLASYSVLSCRFDTYTEAWEHTQAPHRAKARAARAARRAHNGQKTAFIRDFE